MAEIDDLEKEVVIKLKKWQVEKLLGAARLGIWAEDWCAALIQTNINSYDTHSGRWILRVGYVIDEIKKQTGVIEEDKEYGRTTSVLEDIDKWVNEQCKVNVDNWAQYEEEMHQEYERVEAAKKKHNKVQKEKDFQPPKPISIKITKEMEEKVMQHVNRIKKEKR